MGAAGSSVCVASMAGSRMGRNWQGGRDPNTLAVLARPWVGSLGLGPEEVEPGTAPH